MLNSSLNNTTQIRDSYKERGNLKCRNKLVKKYSTVNMNIQYQMTTMHTGVDYFETEYTPFS